MQFSIAAKLLLTSVLSRVNAALYAELRQTERSHGSNFRAIVGYS